MPVTFDLEPEYRKLGLHPRAQGQRNTCSLFAITALAEFEYNSANPETPTSLSEEFLVWAANEATGQNKDQAMFSEAVHGLNALGICRADLAPYQRKAAGRPSKQAVADAKSLRDRWKVNWIKRWSLDSPLSKSQLQEIKIALANGHPVAAGMRWPNKNGISIITVPDTKDVFDGHSVTLTGYKNDSTKPGGGVFMFRNSSGTNWGQNGYGELSYAYAHAYFNDVLWLECGAPGSETPTIRFELESLPMTPRNKYRASVQDMNAWGEGMWSNGKQRFCQANNGGKVKFRFRIHKSGTYRVRLLATSAPDFGTIRVTIGGKKSSADFDLYAGRVLPTGSLELGEHRLSAGNHTLQISVVGKNQASTGYYFGLDTLDLMQH